MKVRSWSSRELKDATKKSSSYRQVLVRLGLKAAGGNYEQIKKYIKEYGIDISHFKGRGWSRGLTGIGRPRVPLEKILVRSSNFQSFKLKKRLFVAGLKSARCERCGWAEKTTGGYLPLELDHINGDHHDNRLENLRVLCPNCHSLTDNHRGRSGRGKTKHARVLE